MQLLLKIISLLKNNVSEYNEDSLHLIFYAENLIGLSKFPIDGNTHSSLAMNSHYKGVNMIACDYDHKFLFSTGIKDSWVEMYEINAQAVKISEQHCGKGIDAFKNLFPGNENAEEMKQRLLYSVYSLELEMKLLNLNEGEEPILKGEIPISCLEYVMAALGCFLSHQDLQLMLNAIEFENRYCYDGKKNSLNCLDIIKLYVNYRPDKPLTKEKIRQSFKDVLSSEVNPDKISRSRFLDILTTRGEKLPPEECLGIMKCLKDDCASISAPPNTETSDGDNETYVSSELNRLIPDVINENVFIQDILSLEKENDDISSFVLTKKDYNLTQDKPTLDDFVKFLHENNFQIEV